MNRPASFASAIFLLAIAVGHVLRILFNVQVIAGGFVIPLWPSVPAVFIPAALAVWLLKERRAAGG